MEAAHKEKILWKQSLKKIFKLLSSNKETGVAYSDIKHLFSGDGPESIDEDFMDKVTEINRK